MSKHSLAEKLNIVSQVNKGKPIKRLSKDCHIREGMLLEWVRKYALYGEAGLQKQPNIRATSDFKEEVVRLIMEKHLPLPQVVLQYGVSKSAFGKLDKDGKGEWLCLTSPTEETGTTVYIYGTTKEACT
jgi:transposase